MTKNLQKQTKQQFQRVPREKCDEHKKNQKILQKNASRIIKQKEYKKELLENASLKQQKKCSHNKTCTKKLLYPIS